MDLQKATPWTFCNHMIQIVTHVENKIKLIQRVLFWMFLIVGEEEEEEEEDLANTGPVRRTIKEACPECNHPEL